MISTRHDSHGNALRSFRGPLTHLAILTCNQVRYHRTNTEIPMLTVAASGQRRTLNLIDAAVPLTAA